MGKYLFGLIFALRNDWTVFVILNNKSAFHFPEKGDSVTSFCPEIYDSGVPFQRVIKEYCVVFFFAKEYSIDFFSIWI